MIKITDLKKTFGKEKVLKNINLFIEEGERVVIFGDNGSGKTTLLRCIIGLYGYEGKIDVFSMDARTKRSKIAERTGYTPQMPPPISMSVSQLIDFVFNLSKKQQQKTYDMLDRIGFYRGSINRSFKKLSGGMQKKVLIAIALGRTPDLLIFDEPVAYIDPDSRRIISNITNSLPQDITILYTSHASFKTPEIIPSRIIEMDDGQIVSDRSYDNKSNGGKDE